jgi:hypothetical protein
MWEPPTVTQAIPNQRSPRQLHEGVVPAVSPTDDVAQLDPVG